MSTPSINKPLFCSLSASNTSGLIDLFPCANNKLISPLPWEILCFSLVVSSSALAAEIKETQTKLVKKNRYLNNKSFIINLVTYCFVLLRFRIQLNDQWQRVIDNTKRDLNVVLVNNLPHK